MLRTASCPRRGKARSSRRSARAADDARGGLRATRLMPWRREPRRRNGRLTTRRELLPVLKEAGVVDAGAQGLAVMLDGMVRGLRGDEIAGALDLGAIDASWLSATRRAHDDGERSGICTEFVVSGSRARRRRDARAAIAVGRQPARRRRRRLRSRARPHGDAGRRVRVRPHAGGRLAREGRGHGGAVPGRRGEGTPASTALAVVAVVRATASTRCSGRWARQSSCRAGRR